MSAKSEVFAKVYASMWEGTLAGSGEVWAVFVYMLANCSADGVVDIHPKVISAMTGFPEDRVRHALSVLESPDENSRTGGNEGRRIVRLDDHRDWGWSIVNYGKYREKRDPVSRREQNREAQERRRSKLDESGAPSSVKWGHQPVASSSVSQRQPASAQGEVEVEVEVERKGVEVRTSFPPPKKSTPAARGLSSQRPDPSVNEKATCHGCRQPFTRPSGSRRDHCPDCHGKGLR